MLAHTGEFWVPNRGSNPPQAMVYGSSKEWRRTSTYEQEIRPETYTGYADLVAARQGFHRAGRRYRSTPCPEQDPLRALTDPTALIDAAACFSAVEDMAETLGDPYFAARVAIETARTGSPGIRDAASHAVNLGDFLVLSQETAQSVLGAALRLEKNAMIISVKRNAFPNAA